MKPNSEDDEPSLETPADDEVPATVAVDPSQFATEATEDAAPEPFQAAEDEPFEPPPEATTDEVVEGGFEDEPSMADTSPVEPPSEDDGQPTGIRTTAPSNSPKTISIGSRGG